MNMLLIGAAVLAGFAVFCLILSITSYITRSTEVDDRLFAYANSNTLFSAAEEQRDVSDRVNRYLSQRKFSKGFAINLARAGVKLTVPEFVLIKLAALLIPMALMLFALRQLWVGLILGAVCSMLPDLWLRIRQGRRAQEFVQQLPDTLALIVSGLRAGFSLQQALVNVSKEAPEPTASEFNRVSQELQLGVPLLSALDSLVRRIKSEDLDMIVSVFKIHSRVGGNLAVVLDTVSTTIRERVRLQREIHVITSMQRYSSYILGLLPPALALVLLTINPGYILEMFQWNILLCIPIGATIMTILGFLVIRKIADIKI
jgi:tight adherence protein B